MGRLGWLIASFLLLCSGWAVLANSIQEYAERDEARPADAAIVLGAGVWRGRPSPVFRERLNHAIALYQSGKVDYIITTGGVGNRDTLSEAEVGRNYAITHGVPAEAILMETNSQNTIQNLAGAQAVAAEQGLTTFLIVSTPYHMKRAIWITEDLGMEAYPSPTRTIRWINDATRTRALVQETISYTVYAVRRLF